MIKVVEIIKRRPDLDVEAFQHHWLNTHGPIVAQIPGLRRYVQSHTRLGGYRRSDVPYDGIAEVWFDDKEALAAIASTREFAAAKTDEPNFIDVEQLIELVVDDHIVKEARIKERRIKDGRITDGSAPASGIKNVEFIKLSPTLDPPEAHDYWRNVHGPIAARIPTMNRYVQSHVRMGAYQRSDPPPYDGVAITWWDDIDALRASAASPEYHETRADEPNFLAEQPEVILTTEHVIVAGENI